MTEKSNAPREYVKNNNRQNDLSVLVEFSLDYLRLKQIYREGWIRRNLPEKQCESVADHSFGVALLSYVIAEEYMPQLNISKVMKMALIHDLPEVIVGDITPLDNISVSDKNDAEYEALSIIFSRFSNPDNYLSLFKEYQEQKSDESKFVYQIDKLEMLFQAVLYEYQGPYDLSEFFPDIRNRLKDPILKKLFEDAIKIRK
jgi:putative hydrolases of HD superfamily